MLFVSKKNTAATISSVEALAQGLFRYASIEKTVSFKLPHFASHDQYIDIIHISYDYEYGYNITSIYFSIEK